ncbi:MAG TPA: ribonuclease III [Candidatus Fimenecus excrementigallinarum]|uniref:Ribonuclease 3 n=1 Tax=Candidatus Fimenecus excrementigallinarum TaxID=2840816 RepID=A0A9D1LFB9_9FIRM|nr:ribonuclease III [Candidatus Fimenecus excrementigallinarum]
MTQRNKALEEKLGYTFQNPALLTRALTHSSYANEQNAPGDNERLEFLGDSVLGFITAEYLFSEHKGVPEGELTRLRAYAVCEKSLDVYAKQLGLGEFLLLGKGEERTGGRTRASVLSDAFEAVIAAMYLDGGMEAVKPFVLRYVGPYVEAKPVFRDYKTTLQEVTQQNPGETLEYVVVSESGPDHDKHFTVEVHLNSNVLGRGSGPSKKKAEQAAARQALELMGL